MRQMTENSSLNGSPHLPRMEVEYELSQEAILHFFFHPQVTKHLLCNYKTSFAAAAVVAAVAASAQVWMEGGGEPVWPPSPPPPPPPKSVVTTGCRKKTIPTQVVKTNVSFLCKENKILAKRKACINYQCFFLKKDTP